MEKGQALVTGGTGFVGSHLVKNLLKSGWGVDIVIRQESKSVYLKDFPQKVRVHEHAGTYESMQEIIDSAQPDVVYHAASFTQVEHQPADVNSLINSNLLLGTHLAEALTQMPNSPPIVNTGTFWQHYKGHTYNPVNLYAATKQAFEDIIKYYVEVRGLRAITLKLSDNYGPDDARPKLLNLLKKAARNKETLSLTPGYQLIDLVHVDDVVNAFLMAANRACNLEKGIMEDWAVSSGNLLSLRDLVKKLESIWECEIPVQWGGKSYREREVMEPKFGEWLPGWEPTINLEEGLKELGRD